MYGHLSDYAVASGSVVKKGDVIGFAGHTGEATGPHLHFETRIRGTHLRNVAVDPRVFFR